MRGTGMYGEGVPGRKTHILDLCGHVWRYVHILGEMQRNIADNGPIQAGSSLRVQKWLVCSRTTRDSSAEPATGRVLLSVERYASIFVSVVRCEMSLDATIGGKAHKV